jgi:hypothetical protein
MIEALMREENVRMYQTNDSRWSGAFLTRRRASMYRTISIGMFGILLGLAIAADSVLAEPVKHGAFTICQSIDGGTVSDEGAWEKCCGTVKGGTHAGQKYCVACEKLHPDNCVSDTTRQAPITKQPGQRMTPTPPAQVR